MIRLFKLIQPKVKIFLKLLKTDAAFGDLITAFADRIHAFRYGADHTHPLKRHWYTWKRNKQAHAKA